MVGRHGAESYIPIRWTWTWAEPWKPQSLSPETHLLATRPLLTFPKQIAHWGLIVQIYEPLSFKPPWVGSRGSQ